MTLLRAVVSAVKAALGNEPVVTINLAFAIGLAIWREATADLALTGQHGAVAVALAIATVLARRLVTPARSS